MQPTYKQRILVVDDFAPILKLIDDFLSSKGFHIESAKDGNTALSFFRPEPFDLVITDLNMPGMDGSTLSRRLKEITPKTKIVLITGNDNPDMNMPEINQLFDAVVYKPFKMEELYVKVTQLLATGGHAQELAST